MSDDERLRIHSILIQNIKYQLNIAPELSQEDAPAAVKTETEDQNVKIEPGEGQPKTKKVKLADCMDWLDDMVELEQPSVNVEPDIKAVEECEGYNSEPSCKDDPLDLWKVRETLYPTVAKFAKNIYRQKTQFRSIPLSSLFCV